MKTETKNSVIFYIGSFLISLFSAYLIYFQTSKYGIGMEPHYPLIAQSFLDKGWGHILVTTDVTYAMLYPFFLAFLSKIFHAEILDAARWLNIVMAFCFSFFSMVLCRTLTKRLIVLLIFGLFIAFSRPVNFLFPLTQCEPVFIFILLLITFSIKKTTYRRLILCGFLTSLAILTRYAGVAIVPSVCLYIFIQKSKISDKVKKCFCYAITPTLTYILYVARNYYFTGTLMGPRTSSQTGLLSNIDRALISVSSWFSGSYLFLTLACSIILGALIWNHKSELLSAITKTPETLKFSLCFLVIYSAFIIVSVTTTALDPLDDRFMSPVFLPILLILFAFVEFAISLKNKNKFLISGLLALFIIASLLSFYKTIKDINFRKTNGAGGCSTTFWQEHELLSYIKKVPINNNEYIFTNNFCITAILKEHRHIQYIPNKRERGTAKDYSDITLENLLSSYPHFENGYIFWSLKGYDDIFFSIHELQSICEIEKIKETSDGILYKVGKCKR